MKIENRKSVSDNLTKFSIFAKENDFIEVTEWTNGEGVDILIDREQFESSRIAFSYDELEAIDYLVKVLRYEKVSEKD